MDEWMPMFTMLIVAMFKMFTMFTMGNDKKKNLSMVSIVAIAVEGKASKRQTAHQAIPVQIPVFVTNLSKYHKFNQIWTRRSTAVH